MDTVLQRVQNGICPICKKPLKYSKENDQIKIEGKLVAYKDTSVIICNEHPCPKGIVQKSGVYKVTD
jgi:hypothetical protein